MSDSSLDSFLTACGGQDALRLVIHDGQDVRPMEFRQPFVLVGRDPNADIRLHEELFDARHALLQLIAGRLLFVEFQSAEPKAPRRAGWIDPGHSVPFGKLRVGLPADAPRASWADGTATRPPRTYPDAMLELRSRRSHNLWHMRKHLVLLGSSSKCKIRLIDPDVSRFHCALVGTPAGLWAVDLLGRGGIAMNGVPVRAARLDDGDTLRIGGFTLAKVGCDANPIPTDCDGNFNAGELAIPIQSLGDPGSKLPALPSNLPVPMRMPKSSDASLVAQFTQLQHQMYASLQQQMADQFQQIMQMFVQGCWTMHQEQSKAVRRELKRIRALTDKLAAMQAKPEQFLAADRAGRALNPGTRATAEGQFTGSSSEAGPPPKSLSAIDQAPVDVHAWLNQRVAEIQSERQNSWQRIVSLIQGKPAPKPASPPSPSNPAAG